MKQMDKRKDEVKQMDKVFPTPEDKQKLLTQLKLLGIKEIHVNFEGGGDDGDIQDMDVVPEMDLEAITADYAWSVQQTYNQETREWKSKVVRESSTLSELLKDLTYAALEETQMDWVNNEGGQGSLIIDFSETPPTITLDLEINVTTTEPYSYSY